MQGPTTLQELDQWILWKYVEPGNRKVPFSLPRQCAIDAHDRSNWMSYERAIQVQAAASRVGQPLDLGFVLTGSDPFVCIDLDGCRNPQSGDFADWANKWMWEFASYSEFSPSGTGVKIFIRTSMTDIAKVSRKLDVPAISKKQPAIEVFFARQFVAFTQQSAFPNSSIELCDTQLRKLLVELGANQNLAEASQEFRDNPDASEETVQKARGHVSRMPDAISGDRGHNATFAVACTLMLDFALSFQQSLELLREYNHRCSPPWTEKELIHKLRGAGARPGERGLRSMERIVRDFQAAIADSEGILATNDSNLTPPLALDYRPFPVNTLPEPLRSIVSAYSASLSCDPGFVALPMLAVCAAAIGNSRTLVLKDGWSATSILWCVIVGESGTQKSPALSAAVKPLLQRQEQAALRMNGSTFTGHRNEVPGAPVCSQAEQSRYVVTDVTIEALAEKLEENWRGLLLYCDELSGWIAGFDKYSRSTSVSANAGHWLSLYCGSTMIVDRKTSVKKSIVVPRPALSVCGGIQPSILDRVVGSQHRENGLLARLLVCHPPRSMRKWTDLSVSEATEQSYFELVNQLLSFQPIEVNGIRQPLQISLSEEALTLFKQYVDRNGQEQFDLEGEQAAAWSKLEEIPARLALIFHCICGTQGSFGQASECHENLMQSAIQLADWFKQEIRRVYLVMQESETDRSKGYFVSGWLPGQSRAFDRETCCRFEKRRMWLRRSRCFRHWSPVLWARGIALKIKLGQRRDCFI